MTISSTDGAAAVRSRTAKSTLARRLLAQPAGAIFVVFVLIQTVCIVAGLIYPNDFRYLSPQNLTILMKAVPVLGCLALGAGILMIAGEFDLSIGSVYTLTAIVMAVQVGEGMSAFLAAPLAILIGIAIGVLNGMITLRFGLPILHRHARRPPVLARGGAALQRRRTGALRSGAGLFCACSLALFWGSTPRSSGLSLLVVAFHLLLHNHWFGNHVFATGGNRAAATAIGINVKRVKIVAFAIAGGMAAFAGILATSRVGSVQPGQGTGLELQAIAACVIGGLSLNGGRGSVIGIFLGVMLIHTITNVLLLVRAPGFYLEMFIATLIVGAAILNQLIERKGAA